MPKPGDVIEICALGCSPNDASAWHRGTVAEVKVDTDGIPRLSVRLPGYSEPFWRRVHGTDAYPRMWREVTP